MIFFISFAILPPKIGNFPKFGPKRFYLYISLKEMSTKKLKDAKRGDFNLYGNSWVRTLNFYNLYKWRRFPNAKTRMFPKYYYF